MNKGIVTILIAILTVANAMAQGFSGEWFRKGSGTLDSKVWYTPEYQRTEAVKNGEKSIIIFHIKDKKAYILNETNKTCMVMNDIDKFSLNNLLGYDLETSRSVKREFKGRDEVDGKDCAHYYVEVESTHKTGARDASGYNEWIYEPMKSSFYSGCIQHDNTEYFSDRTIVLRNIRTGAQPAHLFQIPEGYKTTVVPVGGMLEMLTGKSRQQNEKTVDSTANAIGNILDAFQKKVDDANDPNKSKDEQLKSILELFQQIDKKK